MEIKTKAYGTVIINPENIITFEHGLIGFEDKHRFVLLGNPAEDEPLVWLQSLDDENLAFVVIQPRVFKTDYYPAIKYEELKDLDIEDQQEVLMYSIVVVPQDPKKMTANLKAPLVINVKNNKAKQIILNDEQYKLREYLLAQD